MDISIVTSSGQGSTLLSAFDCALQNAGISNYNIIVLSSIIPPHSKLIRVGKYLTPPGEFGHRLYVVRADQRCDKVGRAIAAGIGWYQFDDGRGLFVEHETEGDSEDEVRSVIEHRITNTIRDMCKFRHLDFVETKVQSAISTAAVVNKPTCVLSIAVYQSRSWNT